MSIISIIEAAFSAKWYIAGTLVVFYVLSSLYSYRRLSHIKGPWLAQFSNWWLLGAIYRQQAHYEFYELKKKYGNLARVGSNTLLSSDPDQIIKMSAPRSQYMRSDWYLGFRLAPGIDNVFSMRDEKQHTRRRAQMNLSYTGKEDINFEPQIDTHVLNLIDLIERKYISSGSDTKAMDLAQKAQFFTIDVITDLATGTPFGDLSTDSDQHDYLRINMEAQPVFSIVGAVPWLTKIIQVPAIGKWLFPTSQDKVGMGKMIGLAEEKAAERFNPETREKLQKPDILQSFINHNLTESETVAECLLLILGGSDTTASAIRATMLCLMTSHVAYQTLQAEIDGANLTRPVITYEEARSMSYLQAVILEGIRMHPPSGGLLSKVTPPDGDVIDGIFVPGGVNIATNNWAVMRSERVFGPDVDCFRPERWLGISKAKYDEMARVVDLVFGSGKYKCLGRTVAWIELNKVFVELFKRFNWQILEPTNPWTAMNVGIILHRDFYVRVEARDV